MRAVCDARSVHNSIDTHDFKVELDFARLNEDAVTKV